MNNEIKWYYREHFYNKLRKTMAFSGSNGSSLRESLVQFFRWNFRCQSVQFQLEKLVSSSTWSYFIISSSYYFST